MTMLARPSFVGIKSESTAGTSSTPTAGSNAIVVYEGELQPLADSTSHDREPMSGNMSQETPISGLLAGSFTCKTYLSGSSAAGTAPPWGVLLIGAGFKQDVTASTSVVYTVSSTVTLGTWSATADHAGMCPLTIFEWANDMSGAAAGKRYALVGAMGNVKFTWKAGELPTVDFDFKGAADFTNVPPAIVSFPAPTFTAHQAPVPVRGASLTFTPSGGAAHTPVFRSLEVDMGMDVVLFPDGNAASGYVTAAIKNRKPSFKLQVEEPASYTPATGQNWWTNFASGVTGSLEIGPLGSGAGRICQVTMPNVGFKKVNKTNGDGAVLVDIEGTLATSAISTGDDEITITFT